MKVRTRRSKGTRADREQAAAVVTRAAHSLSTVMVLTLPPLVYCTSTQPPPGMRTSGVRLVEVVGRLVAK